MASKTPQLQHEALHSSLETSSAHSQISQAQPAMANLKDSHSPWFRRTPKPKPSINHNIPPTSQARQLESLFDKPIAPSDIPSLTKDPSAPKTVLYLAYGSNLAAETFQGARGIIPISQLNVHAPDLDLNFDLPGIPYREPCFAGTNYRKHSKETAFPHTNDLRTPLLPKDEQKWTKGLIGVVYEVTLQDYAHIIATEGGGASYIDIVIRCHPLSSDTSIPEPPKTTPFLAHTLLAPPNPSSVRKPHYAQPSSRYLHLLTTGAAEHSLPADYQTHLNSIQPYTITTLRQRIGAALFQLFWLPIVLGLFTVSALFSDKDGRLPEWLVGVFAVVFRAVWKSYDSVFYPVFGDGERTVEEEEGSRPGGRRSGPYGSGVRCEGESDSNGEKAGSIV
jgi:hypothetical protein